MSLTERIKERRKSAGLRQADFAIAVGASLATIKRWESEKTIPDGNQLKKIAAALNTTVAYLSGETDDPARSAPADDRPDIVSNVRGVVGRGIELPIYTLVACMGKGKDNESEPREQIGTAWLNEKVVGPLGPIKPYLIDVEGTSMEPKIYEGDRLLINENVMPGDGDVCLARFTREGYLRDVIKYYYSTYDGGFILKSSETSGIPPLKISRQQAIEREAFVVGRAMYIDRGEKI